MKAGNPFLSELAGFRRLYRYACGESAAVRTFAVAVAAALLVTFLAILADIACCQTRITSPLTPLCFGYLAEANHGPAYLLIVPVFVATALALLREARDAVSELSAGARLRMLPEPAAPEGNTIVLVDRQIRRRNARLFRKVVPTLLLLSFAGTFVTELLSVSKPIPGWVQAPFLQTMPAASLKIEPPLVGASGVFEKPKKPAGVTPWYYATFLAALTLEALFHAFAAWIAIKIAFIVSLLLEGFIFSANADTTPNLRGKKARLGLVLNPTDAHNFRFGLKPLDRIYDRIATLTLLGAVLVILQYLSNFSKGTWHAFPSNELFVGQTLTYSAVLLCLALIWIFPGVVFGLLTNQHRHLAMLAVARTEALSTSPEEMDKIEKLKSIVHAQRAWPAGDKKFYGISAIVLALVLIALGVDVDDKATKAVVQVAKVLPNVFCQCR